MITLLLVLMVTASAIAAFQYLHSKQKVDLYHSLAISRSKQFVCRFVSGLLNVLIPFVISFGILVAMIYGWLCAVYRDERGGAVFHCLYHHCDICIYKRGAEHDFVRQYLHFAVDARMDFVLSIRDSQMR